MSRWLSRRMPALMLFFLLSLFLFLAFSLPSWSLKLLLLLCADAAMICPAFPAGSASPGCLACPDKDE